MAELKVYCGTEFLGTVPRPAERAHAIAFHTAGNNPGHPQEYWVVRGYLGDPSVRGYAYEICPYWMGDEGEAPIPSKFGEMDPDFRWLIEFVMVAPPEGEARDFLKQIPGWRPAPSRRIIDIPIF
jgi:hypothetical protein